MISTKCFSPLLTAGVTTKPGEYNTRGTAGAATAADEATDTFLLTLTGN
jgi:hypothetical protein